MLDWLDYRRQLSGRIGELGELSPGTLCGFEALAKAGANPEEIAEALGVAISINAVAAMTYSARVMDAVSAHSKSAAR